MEKDLGILVVENGMWDGKVHVQPTNQPYPGLQQSLTSRLQEATLSLYSALEISAGVLHPALGSPVEKRYLPIRAGPDEGNENGQRAETPLLWRKAEIVGVVQPGKEQALWGLYCGLWTCKEDLKMEKLFTKACSDRTIGNSFKLWGEI